MYGATSLSYTPQSAGIRERASDVCKRLPKQIHVELFKMLWLLSRRTWRLCLGGVCCIALRQLLCCGTMLWPGDRSEFLACSKCLWISACQTCLAGRCFIWLCSLQSRLLCMKKSSLWFANGVVKFHYDMKCVWLSVSAGMFIRYARVAIVWSLFRSNQVWACFDWFRNPLFGLEVRFVAVLHWELFSDIEHWMPVQMSSVVFV